MADKNSRKKYASVNVRTFKHWPFNEDFKILEETDNTINCLQCVICSENLIEIRREARRRNIKGTVLAGVVNYADGVRFIHRANIMRHIRSGGLHDWAKKTFSRSKVSDDNMSSSTCSIPVQRIDSMLMSNTSTCYEHLFNTALCVVMMEKSFKEFTGLVELQRKNGVQFLSGKNDDKRCREFVSFLANAMRSDIESILTRANFLSGLMDGSQARKTGMEKELIYSKVVVNGTPIELMLKCQEMADFGGEDALSVKNAFDDAFLHTYNIPEEKYSKSLVSVCTDGASVNMGVRKGACMQLKNDYDRKWLLIIHCSNHNLELAIKDAFTSDHSFLEIDEIMTQIFYMFRNSGKAKRILRSIAITLGVTCVSFVKAHGTRFQNHKYRAAKAMIVNFLPLCVYAENMIETPGACSKDLAAKLRGYLNKFLSYHYLSSLHFYRQVLCETAHASYVMQARSSLITDIKEVIAETKSKLEEISRADACLPFQHEEDGDGNIIISAKGTNLPVSLSFRNRHQLSEKQLKRVEKLTHVTTQEYSLKNVKQGQQALKKIKEKLIPAICSSLDKRFSSFAKENSIYEAMLISDHTTWDYDDNNFGIDQITKLCDHFHVPLQYHDFKLEFAIQEFRQLKALVQQKYKHFKNKVSLWETLQAHFGAKYPHALLVIELCLCVAWSSSTVERGFSTTGRLLSDSRTGLKKDTLDDLLLLRINFPVLMQLDPDYESKLITKSVTSYLSSAKRSRYHCTKQKVTHPKSALTTSERSTFLPTPFSVSSHNMNSLLQDDGHLALSDTDMESDSTDTHPSSDDDSMPSESGEQEDSTDQ